ncbi:A disintegrin and metalloproteinase with thrombospondin motifs 19-like [Physella acuta]|uniref:A disintegrin and metalloproteinase with thrombospondin motifs 19-like n=1 Tax=Physella acuta TaxID=109671 RepID=UPI0027DC49AC|nr:A disintegrin and metalloproteinase with thrombospondin motifs 19-like [Physella acuta]
MAASDSKETWNTLYHPWQFSPCSVRYFTDYITSQLNTLRGYNCLTGRLPIEPDIPYTADQLLGQMYTPDQQCQLVYGPTSYLCRGLHGTDPASICRDMYCQDPDDPDMCIAIRAARGTTCGNGRICENGHCVLHADAPHVDVTCMYGDEPGRIGDFSSCRAMVDDFIGFCSRDSLFASCCSSCNAVKRTVQGCEFGDYYSDCVASNCYYTDMRTKCCEKCNIGVPYTTRRTSTTRPSTTTAKRCTDDTTYTDGGRHCSSIVQNSPYLCYEQEVKDACCTSCQQVNTSEAGCEYGDKAPSWCGHPDACTKFPDKCCGTCSKTGSGIGYGTAACIDESNFRYNGRSCSSAVETYKGNCYNTDFQQTCCRSCLNARNVPNIGCEYGDRNPSDCLHKCNNYKADCCAHCNTSTRLQLSIFLMVMVSALKMFSIL